MTVEQLMNILNKCNKDDLVVLCFNEDKEVYSPVSDALTDQLYWEHSEETGDLWFHDTFVDDIEPPDNTTPCVALYALSTEYDEC